jgi:zinc/manganese transport system permease protein
MSDPHLSLNPISDLEQLLAFQFMVNALLAASIVAVTAGVAGWFMVLRRESFAGHTLSVMAFPGAAGALLTGLPASLGYFAFSFAGALLIGGASQTRGRSRGAQQAAVVGTVQAAALALGFLMLNLYGGVLESPTSLLFGSFLGISTGEVRLLLIVGCGVLAFFVLAGRPLLFASVDESVASAHQVPVRALALAFMLVLGLAVAAIAQITGVLLIFALLVAPPATAIQLTPRIGRGLAISVAIALVTAWLGLGLSYFTNYSAGFYLTTIAFALYLPARLWRMARS